MSKFDLLNTAQYEALEMHVFALPGLLTYLKENSKLASFAHAGRASLSVWDGHELNPEATLLLFLYLQGRMADPAWNDDRSGIQVDVVQLYRLFHLDKWRTPLTADEQLEAIIKFGISFSFDVNDEEGDVEEGAEDWNAADATLEISGFANFKGGYHHNFGADYTKADRLAALEAVVHSIVAFYEPHGEWLHRCREVDSGSEWSSWQPTSDFIPMLDLEDEEDEEDDDSI